MSRSQRQRQYLIAFFIGVLLGIVFAKVVKATPVMAAAPVAAAAQSDDCEFGDECYAVIYYPGICGILPPYSYWYYAFYCDLREGGRLLSMDVTYAADGSVDVTAEIVDEHGRRWTSVRHLPRRK